MLKITLDDYELPPPPNETILSKSMIMYLKNLII